MFHKFAPQTFQSCLDFLSRLFQVVLKTFLVTDISAVNITLCRGQRVTLEPRVEHAWLKWYI